MKNENTAKFLSGFAAIVGRPNVGKSTLMNAMVGEKVAIVSNRPQTTRNRIMGVATDKGWQIVFLDTPGLHKPHAPGRIHGQERAGRDGRHRRAAGAGGCKRNRPAGPRDCREMSARKVKKILVLNKTDIVEEARLMAAIQSFAEAGYDAIVPISARTGKGMDELKKADRLLSAGGAEILPGRHDDRSARAPDLRGDHPRKGAAASARRCRTASAWR